MLFALREEVNDGFRVQDIICNAIIILISSVIQSCGVVGQSTFRISEESLQGLISNPKTVVGKCRLWSCF